MQHFSDSDDNNRHLTSLKSFSTAYFIYDILQIIAYRKIKLLQIAYIYHHLAGIYMLHQKSRIIPIATIMFWGELSNLPSYPLYYYLHTKPLHKNKIQFLRILQKVVYTGIGIPILSLMLIKYIKSNQKNKKMIYPILPVYLMGIIWSCKIISQ